MQRSECSEVPSTWDDDAERGDWTTLRSSGGMWQRVSSSMDLAGHRWISTRNGEREIPMLSQSVLVVVHAVNRIDSPAEGHANKLVFPDMSAVLRLIIYAAAAESFICATILL